jgi:hypothetical protein
MVLMSSTSSLSKAERVERVLKEGDSLTFRGDIAHGPERLIRVPIRMLSIVMYAGTDTD